MDLAPATTFCANDVTVLPAGSTGARLAAGIETHVDNLLLYLRYTTSVMIVEQKTPRGAEGVLAQVALGAPGCFAAFDNLLAVTMRASNRDECHRPLPGLGRYHLRPSVTSIAIDLHF